MTSSLTRIDISRIATIPSTDSDPSPTPTSMPRTPTLTPRPIEPERLNKSANSMDCVGRIRWLQIVGMERKSHEKPSFVIQIYVHQNGRRLRSSLIAAPSTERTLPRLVPPSMDADNEPEYQVHRRFAEFQTLRHALMDAVLESHGCYCRVCEDWQTMLTFDRLRLMLVAWPLLAWPRNSRSSQRCSNSS